MKVSLSYTFVFDPKEAWKSRDNLDADLAQFFQAKGLELEKIRNIADERETAFDERIVFVKKVPEVNPMPKKSVKQQLQGAKPLRRDEKGRISGRPTS